MPVTTQGRLRPAVVPALAVAALVAAFVWPAAGDESLVPTSRFDAAEPREALQGGVGTSVEPLDSHAFAHALFNMPEDRKMDFLLGKALFRKNWVPSPASTTASDGLGPFYNARSCQACHTEDGRGRPFFNATPGEGLAIRLTRGPDGEPDPVYGQQVQDKAAVGLLAEALPIVTWDKHVISFKDGSTAELAKPVFSLVDLADGPLDPATGLSARLAPPLVGMGLIEAIPDAAILANADPDDKNGDGISGKPVSARNAKGETRTGRFGWKAAQSDIMAQSAHALAIDMGLSNPLLPQPQGDCTLAQARCIARPDGRSTDGKEEVDMPVLSRIAFYVRALSVPARRKSGDPAVLAGKEAFYGAGCPACHVPKYRTSPQNSLKPLASQLIWPYSDFLLHDMGPDLADGSGAEWRTPPLWGIGLTTTVSGSEHYLHDGRAKTLEEAILWHGGEGETSRNAYLSLDKADRQALVRFLESL